MSHSASPRTGFELREGSAMIGERISPDDGRRGRYAVRYGGRGHGWWVMVWDRTLDDPHGLPTWLRAAGPFTTREAAIAEAEARRAVDAEAIGGPGWSVKA